MKTAYTPDALEESEDHRSNFSEQRGEASEKIVEDALRELMERPRDGIKVIDFVHAARNSSLDRKKIDFLAKVEAGEVPIQVKSSERKARKFARFCREMGLRIAIVVVKATDTLDSIISAVIEEIRKFIPSLAREHDRHRFLERERQNKKQRKKKQWCHRVHTPCMCH